MQGLGRRSLYGTLPKAAVLGPILAWVDRPFRTVYNGGKLPWPAGSLQIRGSVSGVAALA